MKENMKKKFYQIAKELGLIISSYKTYRSDMGWQVYQINVPFPDGEYVGFDGSYCVGCSDEDKQLVLNDFRTELERRSNI